MLQCQGCHRADGTGIQDVPSLVTDGKNFLRSAEGRDYFVSVPGVANAPLSDQDLTDVINHTIRTIIIKDGDAESFLYQVSEVSAYRKTRIIEDIAKRRLEIVNSFKR